MVTQEYVTYLQSETWQRLRSQRLKIDNYKCQRCGRPFDLQVHHLYYPADLGTEDPYRDLITLCDTCHELVEHQKQAYRKDKKDAVEEERKYELRLIYRTIRQLACNDLSAIGVGKRDYCNIAVIKEDFGQILDNQLQMMGYVSRVQGYFRNRRYRIILNMIDTGLTPREICERTRFSWAMVFKVCSKPETAKAILKNEKETEYYDQAE